MSFNGFFFVARSERPVYELPAIRAGLGSSSEGGPNLELVRDFRRDGSWQMVQCDAEYVKPRDIVADTGAPALVIFTFESHVGDVRAASPDSEEWFAILNPEGGREFQAPDPGPPPEVAARAAAWAVEAGLTPDLNRIVEAIGMRPGPFSEGVSEFLAALGFRFGEQVAVDTDSSCQSADRAEPSPSSARPGAGDH